MSNKRDFLQKNNELKYTLGVVYEPYAEDLQGDFTDEEEIRKAMWNYMSHIQKKDKLTKMSCQVIQGIADVYNGHSNEIKVDITELVDLNNEIKKDVKKHLGDNHDLIDESLGTVVESYQAPVDMVIEGESVKKGSWLLGVVWEDEFFEKVKKEKTGYSMGGKADKIDVS